jgi:hypothetical protein
VALEAGNSASIIFKHYRELTTPEVAEKWFGILPKDGQWENTFRYDRKKRRVILNGVEVAALPVWLEFAIALSAFSVSVFSSTQSPISPPSNLRQWLRQAGRSDPMALSGASRRKQAASSKAKSLYSGFFRLAERRCIRPQALPAQYKSVLY